MIEEKWSRRHITDSAQRMLQQIPHRTHDRGLHVVDNESIVMLTLWSLLLWERKVGRVALEQIGVDPFNLARDVDGLLVQKEREFPVALDRRSLKLVMTKTGAPYEQWDFDALLEPVLKQAEEEAATLGHDRVGSEHLVLAIVQLARHDLAGILRQHSIDHSRVREAVMKLLGP